MRLRIMLIGLGAMMLVAVVLGAMTMIVPGVASAGPDKTHVDRCPFQPEVLKTAAGAHERARKGWNAHKVKKDHGAIERVRIQARCAPTQDGRKYVNDQIDRARHRFKEAKVQQLYDRITASPGQSRLAVLRQCESTNRYNDPSAPAGAYGMLQGWSLAKTYLTKKMVRFFGFPPSPPYLATPTQQDVLASLLYQHKGTSPWECPF